MCHNVNADGTPACFKAGSTGDSPASTGETPWCLSHVPGLPDGGRIERPLDCPPVPEWATGTVEKKEQA